MYGLSYQRLSLQNKPDNSLKTQTPNPNHAALPAQKSVCQKNNCRQEPGKVLLYYELRGFGQEWMLVRPNKGNQLVVVQVGFRLELSFPIVFRGDFNYFDFPSDLLFEPGSINARRSVRAHGVDIFWLLTAACGGPVGVGPPSAIHRQIHMTYITLQFQ